jgi:hypothetical protein
VSVGLAITAYVTFMPTKASAATLTVTTVPVDQIQAMPGDFLTFIYKFTPSTPVRLVATVFGYDSKELSFVAEFPNPPVPIFTIINEPITISRIYKVLTDVKDGQSDTFGAIYYNDLDQFGNIIGLNSNSTLGDDIVPVPEPLTIFGTATALGCGVLFKRKSSKKTVS